MLNGCSLAGFAASRRWSIGSRGRWSILSGCEKFLPHPISFSVHLLIGGPKFAHEKGGHGEGDFAFDGEDGVGTRFEQGVIFFEVSRAGQDMESQDSNRVLLPPLRWKPRWRRRR